MAAASPSTRPAWSNEPHAVGPQVAVAPEIPFSRELGMRGGQVVEAAQRLRFLQYGQLSSMRMERMLTFSRQTWPHDPRHHTMAPA